MELEAAHGQIAMRDGRIRALEMQLRRAEEERSSASAALAAQKEELRQKERELAEKDAEISALKASSSARQHAQQQPSQQQPSQQQQHWRLQRVGSVASTTLRYPVVGAVAAWFSQLRNMVAYIDASIAHCACECQCCVASHLQAYDICWLWIPL